MPQSLHRFRESRRNSPTAPPAPPAEPYTLVTTQNPNRTSPVPLDGASVAGTHYPFIWPDDDDPAHGTITSVTFTDSWSPRVATEGNRPYDYMGGSADLANPWDTTTVADGQHTITATIQHSDGASVQSVATFTVSNTVAVPDTFVALRTVNVSGGGGALRNAITAALPGDDIVVAGWFPEGHAS